MSVLPYLATLRRYRLAISRLLSLSMLIALPSAAEPSEVRPAPPSPLTCPENLEVCIPHEGGPDYALVAYCVQNSLGSYCVEHWVPDLRTLPPPVTVKKEEHDV